MSIDRYIPRLERMARSGDVLNVLRNTPTPLDPDRTSAIWKPTSYFHSMGDTFSVSQVLAEANEDPRSWTTAYQACFAKDIDIYLEGFERGHEFDQLFRLIQRVGTSAYWFDDFSLPKQLGDIYKEASETVIKRGGK